MSSVVFSSGGSLEIPGFVFGFVERDEADVCGRPSHHWVVISVTWFLFTCPILLPTAKDEKSRVSCLPKIGLL
jgi:hypothetical protein